MIAKESIHNTAREPGKRLVSSRDVGWESLLAHKVESPALVESHETVPTQDQAVTVVLSGRSITESASSGSKSESRNGGTSELHHVDSFDGGPCRRPLSSQRISTFRRSSSKRHAMS